MKEIYIILILAFIAFSCERSGKESKVPSTESSKIFLEIWLALDENYAFFELRNIDWKNEKKDFLKSVNSFENDSLLFEEICNLLKKFDDSHINLESDALNLYCNSGKTPNFYDEFPSNESFGIFLRARDNTLKKIGLTEIFDSQSKIFQFGLSKENEWGYLRIKRFYGASLTDVEFELNKINTDLKTIKNLIIDIRTNPGGNDETALLCASYYFKQKEIAFIKTIRNGIGHNEFSQPDTTYIIPNSEITNHSKNIYLLTNSASGSSADVFALIMSYLPNVKIVGKNTEGIFSNMYRDTLSNGWRLTLSNEKYFSKEMKCYEKIGVPVDELIENNMNDVQKGIDLVIEKIIKKKPAANKG